MTRRAPANRGGVYSASNRDHAFIPAVDVRSLAINTGARQEMGVSRLRSPQPHAGNTTPHVCEDAFMLSVQLRDYHGDIYLNGRHLGFRGQAVGEIMFYDYREDWRAELKAAFDCVNFHIPRDALNAAIEDERAVTLQGLNYRPGVPHEDRVVTSLVRALLPSLEHAGDSNQLFVDHVGLAIGAHVARNYGDLAALRRQAKGQLAAWQERRVKELIEDRLSESVTLAVLADECGLSVSHFARAFRVTTGMAPYQWLLQRRVERAREMLLNGTFSVAEIATACGFSDQSHLSRNFSRVFGDPPASWRRRNGV